MKQLIIACICMLYASVSQSQINMVRYNDNFSYLDNDSVHKKGFEKLKQIKLFANTRISFGGELREQFQYYHNQNFGDVPAGFARVSTGQLWQRMMAHSNIEFGDKLRAFIQLGSSFRFFNPNPAVPEIDENKLALQQAFIDYRFQKRWMVRAGRQEISYASHRLLTFREGPNTRLSFDGLLIRYASKKRNVDVFMISPVISKPAVFDDQSFKDVITGVYATEKIIPGKLMLDYYFLHFRTNRRKYNYEAGKESRQSYGFRIFSDNPRFNYELEATYQAGTFNEQDIRAYGISADINYKIGYSKKIITGIGSNYMSGDKSKADNRLNTYNLLFSKPQYGLTAPIGATNLVNINPYIKIMPAKNISIYFSSYFMWRQSNQDGTYSPAGVEMRPAPALLWASSKKQIGTLWALESVYSVSCNLSFALDASYFVAGRYVKETGKGKNIRYLSFKVTYKF